LQQALAERSDFGDRLEVAIAVKEEHIVLDCDLGDAAVDRTAYRSSSPPQVEVDARGFDPRLALELEVYLCVEILAQETPFVLVARALQQFELVKTGEDRFVAVQRLLQRGSNAPATVAK
jgi:hypothetical protein